MNRSQVVLTAPATGQGLHVAIIMDGNGRWATRQGLPRVAGHRAGVLTVRRVVEQAAALGLGRLTLYAFSSDNWRRPPLEVESIFRLLGLFLRTEMDRLTRHGIRFQMIGRRDRLPPSILREVVAAESQTRSGPGLHLCVAVDYSSRQTITAAAIHAAANGSRHIESAMAETLNAPGTNVDLLIRTGGEKRLSDFLLWESAYAELVFTDTTWPDFEAHDLESALEDFHRRQRRFGALPSQNIQRPA